MTTVYTGDKLKINKYYEHTEIIWIILNFKAANSLVQRICIQCGCVCLCEGGRQPECKGVYLIISLECCRASELQRGGGGASWIFFCNNQNLLVFYYSQFISFCRFQELKIKISRNNQEHDDGNSQDFKQMDAVEDNCYGTFTAQKQTERACIISDKNT